MSKLLRCAVIAALASLPAPLLGQVGHDPANSPYRDIRNRSNVVATGWKIGGGGGQLDIGPTDGELLGLRYEMRLTGPSDAMLDISYGRFQRLVPDPGAPEDEQLSGPVQQSVLMVTAGLSVLLTGDKTWNGFAPYVGGSLGLGFGGDVAADSSGYRFNAKFVSGPHLGIRYYATSALSLRLEGRLLFWRLKYPSSFYTAPARAPDDPPLLSQEIDPDTEWTSHPVLVFAVGYAIRL